ncbi:MAG: transposase [Deltaproteobacteria bacterium]|nr:transposase [Deltaproteobacteria bacterium]
MEPKKLRGRFEVNASVRVGADDRAGRAQLVRYAARPPFAEAQLELIDEAQARFTLRRPTRTTQQELLLHPLSLLRRLAWLVPPPRQHQIRAFGVLAPAARLRPQVVPAGWVAVQGAWFGARKFEPATPVPYREAWAKLLARVYEVNGHSCPRCPRTLRRNQFVPVESTGPPGPQQALPLAN